jgi:hypothetical protein
VILNTKLLKNNIYDRLSKKVHISSNGGREQQAFNGNGTYHNGKKYSFFMFSVIVAAG